MNIERQYIKRLNESKETIAQSLYNLAADARAYPNERYNALQKLKKIGILPYGVSDLKTLEQDILAANTQGWDKVALDKDSPQALHGRELIDFICNYFISVEDDISVVEKALEKAGYNPIHIEQIIDEVRQKVDPEYDLIAYENTTDRIDSTAQTARDVLHAARTIPDQAYAASNNPNRNGSQEIITPDGNAIKIQKTQNSSGSNANYKKVVETLKANHPELIKEIEELEQSIRQHFNRHAREYVSVRAADGTEARYSQRINNDQQ